MSKGFFDSFKEGFSEFEKQFSGKQAEEKKTEGSDDKTSDEAKPNEENLLKKFLNQNNIDLDKLGSQAKEMAGKVKESEFAKEFVKGVKENFTAEKLGAAFAEQLKAEAGMPQSSVQQENVSPNPQNQTPQSSDSEIAKNIDKSLIGNWRWTDIYLSGGFSSVSDTYLTLYPNGNFTRTGRMVANNTSYDSEGYIDGMAGFNSGLGADEYGTWQTNGSVFNLQYANGHVSSKEYEASHDCFLLKDDYDENQLWKKI